MRNPKPKTGHLKPLPRADKSTSPLAPGVFSIRLFTDVDEVIRALPNRSAWLRRVITEAAQRELMNQESEAIND